MENEWRYRISEEKFNGLIRKLSRFYNPQIDLPGYLLTLMEDRPGINVAEAFRILSNGRGAGKSYASGVREDDIKEKHSHFHRAKFPKSKVR